MRQVGIRLVLGCALVALVGASACGNKAQGAQDAGPASDAGLRSQDGGAGDAGAPDAATQPVNPTDEMTSAAGRVTGGGYVLEFQMGHWLSQKPSTDGNITIEGGAAVQ